MPPGRKVDRHNRYFLSVGEIAHVRLSGDVEGAFPITEKTTRGRACYRP
jgi:hypothetical protein